jgi:hypothetical protein
MLFDEHLDSLKKSQRELWQADDAAFTEDVYILD